MEGVREGVRRRQEKVEGWVEGVGRGWKVV